MGPGVLAFAAGTLMLAQAPVLPDGCLVQLLPLCAVLAVRSARARPPALLACGFLWALLRAHWIVGAMLPPSLEGRDLLLLGYVADVPATNQERTRFEFVATSARRGSGQTRGKFPDAAPVAFSGRVRISWYGAPDAPRAGERWRLRVRLKRPRGLLNPGGFDYERWLFLQRLAATGYVRKDPANRRVGTAPRAALARLRQSLADGLVDRVGAGDVGALMAALAVGDRSRMGAEQWRILRETGTAHLMAISGLHVGLVAGLVFLVVRRLWSLTAPLGQGLVAQRIAALAALAAGGVYAALAGFALPTQRALVMLTVLMLGLWLRRRIAAGARLATALALVLVLDPLATLSAGFWLSFLAVGVLMLGMSARVVTGGAGTVTRLWWQWGHAQWLVAVGLAPLTVAMFLNYPLAAPLANLLAVPWTGLVVVPLVLTGMALLFWLPALGGPILDTAAWTLEVLGAVLAAIADLVHALPVGAAPPAPILAVAGVGAFALVLPRGIPGRAVAAACLLPLFAWPAPRPPPGAFWLTLLDVGQGLAVVVRTRHHTLVYDTGPRYGASLDAGGAVIAPFLRYAGRRHIDTLVLGHGHADHVGGSATLLATLTADRVLTNVPGNPARTGPCIAGQAWWWDGVEFRVLHPDTGAAGADNDASCVLLVSANGVGALLPGDIEIAAETALVARQAQRLSAQVLVVAHHGSETSSSDAFLDAVHPRIGLLAVGYRNRHGLPDAIVVARLRAHGIALYDTAHSGAIEVRAGTQGTMEIHRLERPATPSIWRAPAPDEP